MEKPEFLAHYNERQVKIAGYRLYVDPKLIDRDPEQPRTEWGDDKSDEAEVGKLADGIRHDGQLNDIMIRPGNVDWGEDPRRFVLVDGERRWRAAIKNRAPFISAILAPTRRHKQDYYQMSVALNFNRKGHSPLETARAFTELRERCELPTKVIAERYGVSEGTVENYLLVLKLPKQVLAMMGPPTPKSKRLPTHTALLLLQFKTEEEQVRVAQLVQDAGLLRYQVQEMLKQQAAPGADNNGARKRKPKEQFHVLRRLLGELGIKGGELLSDDLHKLLESRTEDELKELFVRAAGTAEVLLKLLVEIMGSVNRRSDGLDFERAQTVSDQMQRSGELASKLMIGVYNQPEEPAKPSRQRKKVS